MATEEVEKMDTLFLLASFRDLGPIGICFLPVVGSGLSPPLSDQRVQGDLGIQVHAHRPFPLYLNFGQPIGGLIRLHVQTPIPRNESLRSGSTRFRPAEEVSPVVERSPLGIIRTARRLLARAPVRIALTSNPRPEEGSGHGPASRTGVITPVNIRLVSVTVNFCVTRLNQEAKSFPVSRPKIVNRRCDANNPRPL
jgi:hypothetical protein